jgi:hypothetical protein
MNDLITNDFIPKSPCNDFEDSAYFFRKLYLFCKNLLYPNIDVEIPDSMQRVMAMEAEAIRKKRARLIKADAECKVSLKLPETSKIIAANPLALELHRMQMVQEIGADKNTATVIMMPSDMITLSGKLNDYLSRQ